ncbi:flagellar basal body rod protein FlgB [Nitratiruptor tergarcus]|uniref:Flagellar basal body rod protein FlgB n=1 Tax=Nitratiruptor tergarcus DSM 16512 TaxID=1069081 RepID=A0A1W1WSL2_9BACT|nr:flagellar basal body rod protein FlgB [Nitratiruptor tergarcus]SMC09287.1 flagellar basal-body rod protein FlgB [Nitratiruptor tergarcus DSM 16512]
MWDKIDKISQTASFYLERTKVIQSNIANADTPGYVPKELVFAKELERSMELKKDNPKHIEPTSNGKKFKEIELSKIRGYDDNRVDVQEELAKLAESSIMYKSLAENLKKEFAKLKLVISGR